MLTHIKNIIKAPFIRSITILSAGSMFTQIINFVCSLLITRQYPKDEIGYFTYILSIVSIFATVINGRYDVPIVSEKNEKKAHALIKLSFYLCCAASILITLGAYFYINFSFGAHGQYGYLTIWICPLLFISGLINILNAYNNRNIAYKLISSANLIRTAFQNAFTILFGLFQANAFSLLFSQFLGQLFGLRRQSKHLSSQLKSIHAISNSEVKEVIREYKNQPIYSAPASFVNALSYSIISLLVGNLYLMETLALYSISVRVLGLPLSVFSTNIAKVHFKEASNELYETGTYKKSTARMFLFSALLAIGMTAILMLFAPGLFALLYGDSWRESGVYVQILAPMFGLRLMVGSLGYSFIIAQKQKIEFIFQIMLLISAVALVACCRVAVWDMNTFLTILSLFYSVIYLVELVAIINYSRRQNF